MFDYCPFETIITLNGRNSIFGKEFPLKIEGGDTPSDPALRRGLVPLGKGDRKNL
jgi:hypothetical protein